MAKTGHLQTSRYNTMVTWAKTWSIVLLTLLITDLAATGAQAAEYQQVKTIPLQQIFATARDWHVSAYQTTAKIPEMTDDPARICFEATGVTDQCTRITSALPGGQGQYNYQIVNELSLLTDPPLIKFVADYSGGGSGTLEQVTFWRFDKASDMFEQAGRIMLTEQGEYQLFTSGPLAGLLVTADARLGKGETHFAPHRFDMTVYHMKNGYYAKQFSYLTKKKYPSLDAVEKIEVIAPEKSSIVWRLKS